MDDFEYMESAKLKALGLTKEQAEICRAQQQRPTMLELDAWYRNFLAVFLEELQGEMKRT
jgi:hypothetical protein